MADGDGFESGLEPGVRLDAVWIYRLYQRGDTSPCGGAFVVAGEQCAFFSIGNWPGKIVDTVAIHLDAAVGEEELEGRSNGGCCSARGLRADRRGKRLKWLDCCSASSFVPPTLKGINVLPRLSASNVRAEQQT